LLLRFAWPKSAVATSHRQKFNCDDEEKFDCDEHSASFRIDTLVAAAIVALKVHTHA